MRQILTTSRVLVDDNRGAAAGALASALAKQTRRRRAQNARSQKDTCWKRRKELDLDDLTASPRSAAPSPLSTCPPFHPSRPP